MIFQKTIPKQSLDSMSAEMSSGEPPRGHDEVETIVGPSVNVEGDFASEGNIVVKWGIALIGRYTGREASLRAWLAQ